MSRPRPPWRRPASAWSIGEVRIGCRLALQRRYGLGLGGCVRYGFFMVDQLVASTRLIPRCAPLTGAAGPAACQCLPLSLAALSTPRPGVGRLLCGLPGDEWRLCGATGIKIPRRNSSSTGCGLMRWRGPAIVRMREGKPWHNQRCYHQGLISQGTWPASPLGSGHASTAMM